MTDIPESLVDWQQRHYADQQSRIVARLRALADDIERVKPQQSADGTRPHVHAAIQVIHEIQTTLFNLPLDLLVKAAATADEFGSKDQQ